MPKNFKTILGNFGHYFVWSPAVVLSSREGGVLCDALVLTCSCLYLVYMLRSVTHRNRNTNIEYSFALGWDDDYGLRRWWMLDWLEVDHADSDSCFFDELIRECNRHRAKQIRAGWRWLIGCTIWEWRNMWFLMKQLFRVLCWLSFWTKLLA